MEYLEVFVISEKALAPYVAFVLLFSLIVNLAPHQVSMGDFGSRVGGFWEDLFGSSDSGESPPLSASSSDGSSKMFLEVSGVVGESTDQSHKEWIEILSFSMGMAKPSSGTTMRSRGDVVIEDIIVLKEVDKASPKLMEKCAKGQVVTGAVIEFCRDFGGSLETVYRYELSNVLITSIYCSGSTGEYVPVEEVSLNFEEITVTYTEFDAVGKSKGNVEFTWKVEEAEA